jgi:hypothetical protein
VADLITHGCVALLAKAPTARAHVAAFVAGTFLPDLFGRVPSWALSRIGRTVTPVDPTLIYWWDVLHLPSGMVALAFTLAQLFPAALRRAVFWNLLGGMFLHLAVDLLQSHLSSGYLLLWPFSTTGFELRWMGSEDSIFIVPLLVPVTWAVWRWTRPPRTGSPLPPAPARPSSPRR